MPKPQLYLVGVLLQMVFSILTRAPVDDRPVFLFGQIKSEIGKDDEVYLHELDSKPVAVKVRLPTLLVVAADVLSKANAKVTRFDPVPQYEKMQPAFPTPDISAMMESLKINVPVKAKYQWILPSRTSLTLCSRTRRQSFTDAEREAELARTCTSTGSSSVTVNDLLHGTPPSAATMPTLKSALNLLPSSFRPHYNSATRKPVLIAYCKLYVHPNRAYLRRLLVKSERH